MIVTRGRCLGWLALFSTASVEFTGFVTRILIRIVLLNFCWVIFYFTSFCVVLCVSPIVVFAEVEKELF